MPNAQPSKSSWFGLWSENLIVTKHHLPTINHRQPQLSNRVVDLRWNSQMWLVWTKPSQMLVVATFFFCQGWFISLGTCVAFTFQLSLFEQILSWDFCRNRLPSTKEVMEFVDFLQNPTKYQQLGAATGFTSQGLIRISFESTWASATCAVALGKWSALESLRSESSQRWASSWSTWYREDFAGALACHWQQCVLQQTPNTFGFWSHAKLHNSVVEHTAVVRLDVEGFVQLGMGETRCVHQQLSSDHDCSANQS